MCFKRMFFKHTRKRDYLSEFDLHLQLCVLVAMISFFSSRRSLVFERIANGKKVTAIRVKSKPEYSYWQAFGLRHLIFRQT